MRNTIGERWNRLMEDHFVGRTFEIELFRRLLSRLDRQTERILNVHGTAGMGKTVLLHRFASIARELGAVPVYIGLRETGGDPETVCRLILEGLEAPASANERAGTAEAASLEALHRMPENRKVVLLLDEYEEAGPADSWLRVSYLPRLPSSVLLAVAGRFPLDGPWRYAPAWNRLIVRLPLAELPYEDIRAYLRKWGVTDEETIDAVWLRTLGHPLAVSLAAPNGGALPPAAGQRRTPLGDPIRELLEEWLREAPDDELRKLLFAASCVRTFQQELLEALIGEPIGWAKFDRLLRVSFVLETGGGWKLHEVAREALVQAFRERMPGTFERYRRAASAYWEQRIEEGLALGKPVTRDLAELLHAAGNSVLRAHYRHERTASSYLEPLGDGDREDFAAYVDRRTKQAKAWNVRCSDPESGALYRFAFTPEESLLRLTAVPWEDILRLPEPDRDIGLQRNGEGRVTGVYAYVRIHAGTLDFLGRVPLSRAWVRTLTAERRKALAAEGGGAKAWYQFAVDAENLEEEEIRSDNVRRLFGRVMEGCLIVASPPPLDYYDTAMPALGFDIVSGAEHDDYGQFRPARTYELDTRNGKLRGFLNRILEREGTVADEPADAPAGGTGALAELTEREKDVARLLAAGQSNAEIAAALYVSEAAVKKHVNAMLSKFGLKNRTQLARLVLETSARF
ncbi:LuxR family transcriptional regulator [Cohnella caldifontis]|uniref:LuxR family transcriptional regulator n=1 Tax=Cohnella caldifontis TaxID=3027471 RepID=UPI0023EB6983|nr:LuxR family transcriptional regulator [Cohnella sp. YIM B05605]